MEKPSADAERMAQAIEKLAGAVDNVARKIHQHGYGFEGTEEPSPAELHAQAIKSAGEEVATAVKEGLEGIASNLDVV
jgi:hypothetical protein